MDNELTDKQHRAFELVTKAMRKKFNYINGMYIEEITEYSIYFVLVVDFLKFLDFYKVPMNNFYQKYGLEDAKEYFHNQVRPYTFIMIANEYSDNFGNEFNSNLETHLNGLYLSLPKDMLISDNTYGVETIKQLRISGFKIEVIDHNKKGEETPHP